MCFEISFRKRIFQLDHNTVRINDGIELELGDQIKQGGNSVVLLCQRSDTGEKYALKMLMHLNSEGRDEFANEIDLCSQLKGDHFPRYIAHGVAPAKNNSLKSYEGNSLPFFVMELASSNLQNFMEPEVKPIIYSEYALQFKGLAKALASLHERNIVHRDIKPENILIVGGRWLLCDYGLSSYVRAIGDPTVPRNRNVGPRYWMSPEALNRRLNCREDIIKSSDVFQLASVFWYVATGRHPSGNVTINDWIGSNELYDVLHASMFHNAGNRPQNGQEFYDRLNTAL